MVYSLQPNGLFTTPSERPPLQETGLIGGKYTNFFRHYQEKDKKSEKTLRRNISWRLGG